VGEQWVGGSNLSYWGFDLFRSPLWPSPTAAFVPGKMRDHFLSFNNSQKENGPEESEPSLDNDKTILLRPTRNRNPLAGRCKACR
jgi:hypothetical protein